MSDERLAAVQLDKEAAIQFAQNGEWKDMPIAERGLFQLRQQFLCMDFSAFHEGITELLGRSVWTHEFADPDTLWREYLGIETKPDMESIIGKLDKYRKPVVVVAV